MIISMLGLQSAYRLNTLFISIKKLGLQSALSKESYYTLMRLINKLGLQSALGLPS